VHHDVVQAAVTVVNTRRLDPELDGPDLFAFTDHEALLSPEQLAQLIGEPEFPIVTISYDDIQSGTAQPAVFSEEHSAASWTSRSISCTTDMHSILTGQLPQPSNTASGTGLFPPERPLSINDQIVASDARPGVYPMSQIHEHNPVLPQIAEHQGESHDEESGTQRSYNVPGCQPLQGTYVQEDAEEMYMIPCRDAHDAAPHPSWLNADTDDVNFLANMFKEHHAHNRESVGDRHVVDGEPSVEHAPVGDRDSWPEDLNLPQEQSYATANSQSANQAQLQAGMPESGAMQGRFDQPDARLAASQSSDARISSHAPSLDACASAVTGISQAAHGHTPSVPLMSSASSVSDHSNRAAMLDNQLERGWPSKSPAGAPSRMPPSLQREPHGPLACLATGQMQPAAVGAMLHPDENRMHGVLAHPLRSFQDSADELKWPMECDRVGAHQERAGVDERVGAEPLHHGRAFDAHPILQEQDGAPQVVVHGPRHADLDEIAGPELMYQDQAMAHQFPSAGKERDSHFQGVSPTQDTFAAHAALDKHGAKQMHQEVSIDAHSVPSPPALVRTSLVSPLDARASFLEGSHLSCGQIEGAGVAAAVKKPTRALPSTDMEQRNEDGRARISGSADGLHPSRSPKIEGSGLGGQVGHGNLAGYDEHWDSMRCSGYEPHRYGGSQIDEAQQVVQNKLAAMDLNSQQRGKEDGTVPNSLDHGGPRMAHEHLSSDKGIDSASFRPAPGVVEHSYGEAEANVEAQGVGTGSTSALSDAQVLARLEEEYSAAKLRPEYFLLELLREHSAAVSKSLSHSANMQSRGI
jgi:hypothetical protein